MEIDSDGDLFKSGIDVTKLHLAKVQQQRFRVIFSLPQITQRLHEY